jgi:hypothetical protein
VLLLLLEKLTVTHGGRTVFKLLHLNLRLLHLIRDWKERGGLDRIPLQTAGYRPRDRTPQGSAISTLPVPLRHTGLEPDFGSLLGVTPELRHLQVSLGTQTSYRKAAALFKRFLPPMGGTTHTTTRSRIHGVGERIDEQIQEEIAENRKADKPAERMIIGSSASMELSS